MSNINYNKKALKESLHTITDYVRWGASLFKQENLYYGHGNASAIDEAAYLVLYTLNLEPDIQSVYFSSNLTSNEKEYVIDIIFRRALEKIPAAYLTNESWFANLSFYVDPRVLVPRSPIAELIQNYFEPWIESDNVERILDLCTGSGCIACACAYCFPQAEIDAVDISSDALDVAKINIENHHLIGQVRTIESDLFNKLQGQQYNIIVSNPPYVDADDMQSMPQEFKAEPELGLAAGDDGLDLVIPMLEQAASHLYPEGILIVEVGNSEYALQERYPDLPFYWMEFEKGGHGVFLLTKEQLEAYFGTG
ncbi:MAG: 50S ribosomal protein L3 N(5)-glutamine methyltransferase [gamma proteobacterium symbiont of Taylorina sp.]|nr:50S ribosomal protein L3 N(5)-glutamine methyltransferase [gamma proteobacterium symbiont of Taylorina sp.]